jgi:4-hydroxybenzoate polyprenyltransferase
VPQVLGWVYFSILTKIFFAAEHRGTHGVSLYAKADIARYILFFIALVSIAAFGYLLNDLCDVEADTKSGKPNGLAGFVLLLRIVIVSIPLAIGVVAWMELNRFPDLYLPLKRLANLLFCAQITALVFYSVKPLRLKERAELGILTDAFYGHLNPVLITLCVFGFSGILRTWGALLITLLVLVCFIKGIRNILLHQIEDRKKDIEAGLNTAVTKYGPWRVINLINRFLFPAEVGFLILLTLVICTHIPPCIICLAAFVLMSYLKFSGWKLGYADRRLVEFKFTYFMNDYYEAWLPVFLLMFLCVYRHEFVFLLILHLALFPSFISKMGKDIRAIRENFKTEEDY